MCKDYLIRMNNVIANFKVLSNQNHKPDEQTTAANTPVKENNSFSTIKVNLM
jgi:hypothetical protein